MLDVSLPTLIAFLFLLLFVSTCLVLFLIVFRLWLRALTGGVPVSLFGILGMRLRGSSPGLVIDAAIALGQAGTPVPIHTVERVFLANKYDILRRPGRHAQCYTLVELIKRSVQDGMDGTEGVPRQDSTESSP